MPYKLSKKGIMNTFLYHLKRHRAFSFKTLILVLYGLILFLWFHFDQPDSRTLFESRLQNLNKITCNTKQEGKLGKAGMDKPEMAGIHDFLITFDPETGTIPRERIMTAIYQKRILQEQKGTTGIQWTGYPSNMGGRTRAIMYDPNDFELKKVWAGSVTGGLWYNNNIADATSDWIPVGDFWSNLAIRCMTYDPMNSQVFYVGTGEAETALQTYRESSGLGTGIWKSTDGGATWNQLPSTTGFAYVTDIIVRNENGNGVIYAGVASGQYKGTNHQSQPTDGLYRSNDGGASWNQVLPNIIGSTVPYAVGDIALGSDNRIYIGSRPNLNNEGAATLLYSDDGFTWTINNQYLLEIENGTSNNLPGRVVLATAPSNSNVVYALIASGEVNQVNGFPYFYCYHILRSADRGVSWVQKNIPTDITSGNNFATIAWHALDATVDPNNADRIYVGGLDMHKSADGGLSWIRVSDWSKMYGGGGPDYLHADQHAIVFKPGSSEEILFGTDGGVFYTSNGVASHPTMAERNTGYNTLQFYTCALHPSLGSELFYGGLQDNGSLYYTGNPLTINDMVSGGDGAYCFFDYNNPALTITSVYYNQYYIFNNGALVNTTSNWSSGTFISPADFDYNLNAIYCNPVSYTGNFQDHILRFTNLTGNIVGTYLTMGTGSNLFFSAVRYSQHSPTGKATVYVGSQSGRLFKVSEAQSNSPSVAELTSTSFPLATLSCIAIGGSEDTLLVTFSNYGVPSVFQTHDGGQTWQDVEANLPDIPVRWAVFHPYSSRHALLATEIGVWESNDLGQENVSWIPSINGMANVRVDMMQVRAADNTVLAATHGRGFFTATWDIVTGIQDNPDQHMRVFPNPTSDVVNIEFDPNETGQIEILLFDATGKELLKSTRYHSIGRCLEMMNLSEYSRGRYYLTLKLNGKRMVSKVLVKI